MQKVQGTLKVFLLFLPQLNRAFVNDIDLPVLSLAWRDYVVDVVLHQKQFAGGRRDGLCGVVSRHFLSRLQVHCSSLRCL